MIGPPLDRFDSSKSQEANLSLGMQQSALPFDWTLGAQYRRENTSNLSQHFRAFKVTGEIKQPIADTVAVVASGGFERTETSEREALIDPLTGFPVLGKGGRFVVDPASARVLTYDMSRREAMPALSGRSPPMTRPSYWRSRASSAPRCAARRVSS